jgi:hypothetical protein
VLSPPRTHKCTHLHASQSHLQGSPTDLPQRPCGRHPGRHKRGGVRQQQCLLQQQDWMHPRQRTGIRGAGTKTEAQFGRQMEEGGVQQQ